jgi:hypothetical protein
VLFPIFWNFYPAHISRNQGAGLLHAEPVEGGIVSARKLKADTTIDHR